MRRALEGLFTAFYIALVFLVFFAIVAMLTYARCAQVDAAGGTCIVVLW